MRGRGGERRVCVFWALLLQALWRTVTVGVRALKVRVGLVLLFHSVSHTHPLLGALTVPSATRTPRLFVFDQEYGCEARDALWELCGSQPRQPRPCKSVPLPTLGCTGWTLDFLAAWLPKGGGRFATRRERQVAPL